MKHTYAIPMAGTGVDLTSGRKYLVGNYEVINKDDIFGNVIDDAGRVLFECFTDPNHLSGIGGGLWKIIKE